MQLVATGWTESLAAAYPTVQRLASLDSTHALLAVQRYDRFRDLILPSRGPGAPVHLAEIAGNDDIVLTGVAPASWRTSEPRARAMYALSVPSDDRRKRVVMRVKVSDVVGVLAGPELGRGGLTVDHVYDY